MRGCVSVFIERKKHIFISTNNEYINKYIYKRIDTFKIMAETRLKEILAFVNHKGGVGKTTTVQSLATGLRRYGKGYFGKGEDGKERKPRILLIDLDPQSSLSFLFGWSEAENMGHPTMYDAMIQQSRLPVYQVREGIYLAPAS